MIEIITIHPEGNMNTCAAFHSKEIKTRVP